MHASGDRRTAVPSGVATQVSRTASSRRQRGNVTCGETLSGIAARPGFKLKVQRARRCDLF
jgi:hypothetical protein